MKVLPSGYPDGIHEAILLEDLRWVKVDAEDRQKINRLRRVHTERALTLPECRWLRKLAERKIRLIEEYHRSRVSAKITDARLKLSAEDRKRVVERAEKESIERENAAIAKHREAIDATKDFGF